MALRAITGTAVCLCLDRHLAA